MAGYLDNYGVKDEKRERLVKRIILGTIAALILGTVLYFWLRDFSQRRAVEAFLDALRKKDYAAAYKSWGCSQEQPCRNYDYTKFLEDWGPKSAYADPVQVKMTGSEHCGTGVFAWVGLPGKEPSALWVEKSNNVIGFAPWQECPGRKFRFGEFWKRMFGGDSKPATP
jgi:hypothetical protein